MCRACQECSITCGFNRTTQRQVMSNRQILLFGFGTRKGSPYTGTQVQIGTGSGRVRSKCGAGSVHGQAVDHGAEYPERERQRHNPLARW